MRSRKRLFLVVVGVAVLFGAAGFLLGQRLESPEEARAEAEEPEAALLAAPVERAELSNDVVIRGEAEFEGAVELELDATLGDGASRVITGQVPDVDDTVNEGDVLIEVSGRPVFALEGSLPAFREFKPGLEGDDVLQLETALERLGYLTVAPDRLYGAATEDAIAAMYEDAGYEARAESETEETALENARDAVDRAREMVANANDGLSDLRKPDTQVQQLTDAENREARVEGIGDAKDLIADAEEALEAVRKDTPSETLLEAIEDLQRAEDTGDAELISDANRLVARAQKADEDRLEAAEEAVENAKEGLGDAEEALGDFDALQAAQQADKDTSDAEEAVVDAQEDLDEAEADLAELEEDIGIRLPAAEIVFLDQLPRTITAVDVERGDFVSGSVMRISGTEVRIPTAISEANRPLIEEGQRVIVDYEQLGILLDGEIIEVADRTGTKGAADNRYYVEIVPVGEYEYSVTELVGIVYRLRIPIERTQGEVLAVPNAALSVGADETSRVEVLNDDGTTRIVEVEVGLQDKNSSLVEITPISGDLDAGDWVATGFGLGANAADADSDSEDEEPDDEEDGGS